MSDEESRHVRNALRLAAGAHVTLFDGAGQVVEATLDEVTRHHVRIRVDSAATRVAAGVGQSLTLAVAFPKSSRQSFMVEKVTELGVGTVIPLVCARSVVIPQKSVTARCRRWAMEAAKQAHRAWLPAFKPPVPFVRFIKEHAAAHDVPASGKRAQLLADLGDWPSLVERFILGQAEEPGNELETARRSNLPDSAIVCIGPEGGWTDEERSLARDAGWCSVSLGEHVLRTETAAVAAAAQWGGLFPTDRSSR